MKNTYYICQYRKCQQYLSEKKIKRHAKFCDVNCARAEGRELANDAKLRRQEKNEKEFYEWVSKNESVVDLIIYVCLRYVEQRKIPISMRGVFYRIRDENKVRIRNGYSKLMAELVSCRKPILEGKFRVVKKRMNA